MSTPSSPAVGFPAAPVFTNTMSLLTPGATFPIRRPATTSHQRAPSHPTFPMHRQTSDTFSHNTSSLEALFNSAINLNEEEPAAPQPITTTPHKRGVSVSASVPMGMGIHARMAAAAASASPRQRTLTGGNGTPGGPGGRGFAGASFQHAPDAMSMPKPFGGVKLGGRFGALSNGSTSSLSGSGSGSEEERGGGVVDLSEGESEDEVFFA